MPMPIWWGKINKHVFNPMALKGDKWSVINHVGRRSGTRYRTPLEAHPVDGGFVFIMVYGPKTDWARNALAAGSAELEFKGERYLLESPRLISRDEAFTLLPETTSRPPGFLNITDYLVMETSPARKADVPVVS
ncbi:MAG TPA: nitroreductase family deazaflavin-dependent oxidoreductase [Acidimicrobiia bacterium]